MTPATKKRIIRLSLSLAMLGLYLGFLVDLPDAWRHVAGADWGFLGLLALWITLDRMLMSYKWMLLVRCRGAALPYGLALRSYYLSTFMGTFLPTTVGADAVRVGAVCGPERPSSLLAASIVMERALGFVAASLAAMLALAIFFWVAGTLPTSGLEAALAFLALSVGGTILSLSAWAGRVMQSVLDALRRRVGGRPWAEKVLVWGGKVLDLYGQYRNHGRTLAAFILLSLLEQSAPVVGTWLAALALHVDLSLLKTAAVAPLALLCSRIPLSIAGFGVTEGFYMVFFPLVGVTLSDSFLLGLVGDLSVMAATLPGGILFALGGFRRQDETLSASVPDSTVCPPSEPVRLPLDSARESS